MFHGKLLRTVAFTPVRGQILQWAALRWYTAQISVAFPLPAFPAAG